MNTRFSTGLPPRMFLVDVEAFGPSPFSGKMTEFGVVDFDSLNWFRGVLWTTKPNPELPAQPLPDREATQFTVGYSEHDLANGYTRNADSAKGVFVEFEKWILDKCAGQARPVFVSDNNGYDFQWMNYGFDSVGMANPFGHSSRRIGDICAGHFGRLNKASAYKSWRKVPHTHESHWDSMGNAIALRKLLEKMSTEG